MKTRKLMILTGILALISCGKEGGYHLNSHLHDVKQSCTISGSFIVCPDGSSIEIKNGKDGVNGADSSIVTRSTVDVAECKEIYQGVYAEYIDGGNFFDVYYNDSCSDSLGEYCDNVKTSYGSSGTFGKDGYGSGDVCLANDLIVIGGKNDLDQIEITVIKFN